VREHERSVGRSRMDMSIAHGHRLREKHGTEQFLEIASGSGRERLREIAIRILRVTS
jgi:hypothetical protein